MNTAPQHLATGKRRRFRFGLRTLLVVVTLAAVGSWGYWVAWPWWVDYRERVRFEQSVRQLKIWNTSEDAYEHLKGNSFSALFGNDYENNIIRIRRYELPRADYLIYLVLPKKTLNRTGNIDRSPCSSVEVFRLPHVLPTYRAVSKWARDELRRVAGTSSTTNLMSPGYLYGLDVSEFLSGDRKNNPGFEYELIYSDPPAKPERK